MSRKGWGDMIEITAHAYQRYRERIADLPRAIIRTRLDCPAVRKAAVFGAQFVRLPSGHRIVIKDHAIVTILPADHFRRQVLRQGLGRYGHTDKAHKREHHGGASE